MTSLTSSLTLKGNLVIKLFHSSQIRMSQWDHIKCRFSNSPVNNGVPSTKMTKRGLRLPNWRWTTLNNVTIITNEKKEDKTLRYNTYFCITRRVQKPSTLIKFLRTKINFFSTNAPRVYFRFISRNLSTLMSNFPPKWKTILSIFPSCHSAPEYVRQNRHSFSEFNFATNTQRPTYTRIRSTKINLPFRQISRRNFPP